MIDSKCATGRRMWLAAYEPTRAILMCSAREGEKRKKDSGCQCGSVREYRRLISKNEPTRGNIKKYAGKWMIDSKCATSGRMWLADCEPTRAILMCLTREGEKRKKDSVVSVGL